MIFIYDLIEELCQSRGITVTTLCKECKIPRSTMTDYKKGRIKSLSAGILCKIADYFDVPMSELTGNPPMVIGMDGTSVFPAVMELFSDKKEKPADQKADGLRDAGYYELTPENQKMIDDLIEKLLKSQSGE